MAVCGTHAGIGREADRPRRARSGRTRPNSPAPPFFPVLSSSRPPPPSNGTLLELRLGGLGLACDAPGPITALLAAAPGVQRIDLAANRLTGDIGALATAVSTAGPAVREVDLAGNALSGRLETACGFAASGALRALDVRPALPASWLLRVGAAADADGVVRSVRANPGRARPRTTHTLSADQAPAAETTTPLTSAAKT